MKQIYFPIFTLFAFTCLTGCRGSRERSIEMETAEHMGHVQAIEFSEAMQLDTLTLETMLIDVRSREATLRRHGNHKVADAYLNSFLSTLDSVNPSLSEILRAATAQ